MIPKKTIDELIVKHSTLEKELIFWEILIKNYLQKNQKSILILMKL